MKIGLALSGGGIRGVAHAGVLAAFEKNNIFFDIIGGTSSGAIVASLYAMGYSPYHIFILFKRYAKEITKLNAEPIISGIKNCMIKNKSKFNGFRSGICIEKLYNEFAIRKNIYNISQIKMPIVIPTVDITESKEYVFTNYIPKNVEDQKRYIADFPIGKAIRASSCFPVFFSPCKYKTHMFIDGGTLDNIPVNDVKKQGADKVIAVKFDADVVDNNSNIMDIIMKTIDIMGCKISEESIEMSDYILNVYTDKVGLLDVKKLDKCYQYGYNSVMENIGEIRKKIEI